MKTIYYNGVFKFYPFVIPNEDELKGFLSLIKELETLFSKVYPVISFYEPIIGHKKSTLDDNMIELIGRNKGLFKDSDVIEFADGETINMIKETYTSLFGMFYDRYNINEFEIQNIEKDFSRIRSLIEKLNPLSNKVSYFLSSLESVPVEYLQSQGIKNLDLRARYDDLELWIQENFLYTVMLNGNPLYSLLSRIIDIYEMARPFVNLFIRNIKETFKSSYIAYLRTFYVNLNDDKAKITYNNLEFPEIKRDKIISLLGQGTWYKVFHLTKFSPDALHLPHHTPPTTFRRYRRYQYHLNEPLETVRTIWVSNHIPELLGGKRNTHSLSSPAIEIEVYP
ncbi:hypothetical protein GFS03_04215 [Sulfolobus sp. E5-1-F]|uniref:hypothetical protein n=1 Tax=Saccharolobus sp. E5-1-F TaxID=2663019 RepID=UPI0012949437|nr:hypothetical protein [Sulfolobus sp. E5-1-F]QGA53841.1 hypothetical protein GFS03_04215 [Sulfolobus sp. E5-1-F]